MGATHLELESAKIAVVGVEISSRPDDEVSRATSVDESVVLKTG